MYADILRRPALGQYATLGSLYDARSGNFLHETALATERPEGAVNTEYLSKKALTFSSTDTFTEKSNRLGLDPGLGLTVLAQTIQLERSGRCLQLAKRPSGLYAYRAAHVHVDTVHEALDLSSSALFDHLDEASVHVGSATHVVTEVTWGVRASLACTLKVQSQAALPEAHEQLKSQFSELRREEFNYRDSGHARIDRNLPDSRVEVAVYSDMQHATTLHNITDAVEHLKQVLRMADGEDGEKVVPVAFVLLPLGSFAGEVGLARPSHIPMFQPDPDEYAQLIALYDQVPEAVQKLSTYYRRLKDNKPAVQPEHMVRVAEHLQLAQEAESDLKSSLSDYLEDSCAKDYASQSLQGLLNKHMRGEASPSRLLMITEEYTPKLDFIDTMSAAGGQYVSKNSALGEILQAITADAYALFFNLASMADPTFQANSQFAMEQLSNRRIVVVVDCDATGTKLEKSRVSLFQEGKVVFKDVVAEQKRQAELCFIQYDERYMDRTATTAPAQRKPIKIPCPNQACGSTARDWICIACHVKVEYAAVDGFIYCDCGRVPYFRATFNCQRLAHGQAFVSYPQKQLLNLLGRLPDPPEVNILILGESGVGKSTFINAFINYLTFSSLDQAMSAQELNYIIPCSFSTQRFDPHSESEALIEEWVKIGKDTDEADGSKGQSATQKATVYPLYMDGKLVRLIDTPGIGDVRGPEQDRKNLANILSVLRNYKDLHGILMLLKPNNARLNVMFKFCVKELLGQLHRSAGRNMVFGFTNTRASNYQPGDTYQPLKTLLNEYSDVIKGLVKETVYCFDSESFRYLAAKRQGIELGNTADYRRSWVHSSTEAHRLIAHFQAMPPHRVQQTVTLNETRYLIQQLIQPMANVATAIFDSVAKSKQQIEDLKNTRATGEDLKKQLVISKVVVTSKTLDKPKTVCAHVDCVSYQKDDQGVQVTLRKSLCHNPCCLTDVPPDQIGVQQISACAAFSRGNCRVCPHTWEDHEHIVIEYSVKNETSTDSNVQRLLKGNGNEITAKEAQIKALNKYIDEIQGEQRQIAEAQAKFSHYLKTHCITHWNDATIDYYDHLIKDEKSKAGFGDRDSRLRLDRLEGDKAQYIQFVKAMESGNSRQFRALGEDDVHKLVKSLYTMQHYGSNLKDVADKVGRAYAATFRERPYRLRGHRYWQSNTASNFRPSQLIETKPTRDMQRRTRQFSTEDVTAIASSLSKFRTTSRSTNKQHDFAPTLPQPATYNNNKGFNVHDIEEVEEDDDEEVEEWEKDSEPDTNGYNGYQHTQTPAHAAIVPPQQSIPSKPKRINKALSKGGVPRQSGYDQPPMHDPYSAYGQEQHGPYGMNGYQAQNRAVTHGFGPPVPVAANWEGAAPGKRSSWISNFKSKITRKGSMSLR